MYARTHQTACTLGLTALTGSLLLGGAAGAAPTIDDTISHWRFDEGFGDTAGDSDGRCHGSLVWAEWVAGVENTALEFAPPEGRVEGIDAVFDDPIEIQQAFTIAAWVLWNGPNGMPGECLDYAGLACHHSYVFDGRDADPGDATDGFIFLVQNNGKVRIQIQRPGDTADQSVTSGGDVALNGWTHVAATFKRTGKIRIYIDGAEEAEVEATVDYRNSPISAAIGNNRWASGDGQWAPFNGTIDEVRLYQRALSQSEIQQLASFPFDCAADVDGSGDVGFQDLLTVLAEWGDCPGCPGDIDGNGMVDFIDLLELLSNWGPCP